MLGSDARRLSRLLDRERAMLLRADVDGLGRVADEKARLIDRLAVSATAPAELRALRASAARNDALFHAVLSGIAEARARLDVIRKGAPAGTYRAGGQRDDIGPVRSSLHRRA